MEVENKFTAKVKENEKIVLNTILQITQIIYLAQVVHVPVKKCLEQCLLLVWFF